MSELTPTGRVILGMLRIGKRTGYDIKTLVDKSTRFFWAASYGQIYPELKRLEAEGLIRGEEESTGGRKRTAYALTPDGERALHDWLTSPEGLIFELRDEGLLKFFMADALTPAEQIELVRAMRSTYQERLDQLEAIRPPADSSVKRLQFPQRTLAGGIAYHQHLVDWCDEVEKELS